MKAIKKPGAVRKNISIVLVEPRSSGNVGSVARAMKNTGFSNLRLVNPCDYGNNEAFSMACKADDVLKNADVFKDLKTCVQDAGLVVGATRRKGKIRHPVATLSEAVSHIMRLAKKNRVAILFGREDKGLKNSEIVLCDLLLEIPASEACGSLNISHAVLMVCHAVFTSSEDIKKVIETAPRQEVSAMYGHLEAVLVRLGYAEHGREFLKESILRGFKRLFGRTGLMQKEINMLRGIFAQIEKRT